MVADEAPDDLNRLLSEFVLEEVLGRRPEGRPEPEARRGQGAWQA